MVEICVDGKLGYINKDGSIQIIFIFDTISDFEDVYAQMIQANNNNYIYKQGILF